jgi:hypothetical protein
LKVAAGVGSMKNRGQVACWINRTIKTNLEMSLIWTFMMNKEISMECQQDKTGHVYLHINFFCNFEFLANRASVRSLSSSGFVVSVADSSVYVTALGDTALSVTVLGLEGIFQISVAITSYISN